MTRAQRRVHLVAIVVLALMLLAVAVLALGSGRASWTRAEAIRSPGAAP